MAARKPKINKAAIDHLVKFLKTHKQGIPELLKNAREGYLRTNTPEAKRHVILHFRTGSSKNSYVECVDFAGISGDNIDEKYLDWANPEAARSGLKRGQQEGGQGSGGKGYLRNLFDRCFFASVWNGRLSVVSFHDPQKYVLDFYPDEATGKDNPADNPKFKVRADARRWLDRYDLPPDHNITIARGIGPRKTIDRNRLLDQIQQFAQARQTIESCTVHVFADGRFKRELSVKYPSMHPMFPDPIEVPVPKIIDLDGRPIPTCDEPAYPQGKLELRISSQPLQGQTLAEWNRIEFFGDGVGSVGWIRSQALKCKHPQHLKLLHARCRVPLLKSPGDDYEMPGRGPLADGDLSAALYEFIAEQADKHFAKLEKQAAGARKSKKRENLSHLNEHLSKWIENKLSQLRGLTQSGDSEGPGKGGRKERGAKEHADATSLRLHRVSLDICAGVTYPLRAIAADKDGKPVPAGRLVWKSSDESIAAVDTQRGTLEARRPGLASVVAENTTGLTTAPLLVTVHEAERIQIRSSSPVRIGSNRRLPIPISARTAARRTIKDPIVQWETSDERVVSVGPDGTLVGGEVGEAEVFAEAGTVKSDPLEVEVERGAAGKPRGGGRGAPQILLSGQDECPFDREAVYLDPMDPPVYQRPYKSDYEYNVFWINLQHPLADALLKLQAGEKGVQWRTYHFQRVVDVYTMIELRDKFADSEQLDVDQVLEEIHEAMRVIYSSAQEEIFAELYDESLDIGNL